MNVEEVELNLSIPTGPLRMVLMQPFVRFPDPAIEPYCWDIAHVDQQRDEIKRTMGVAALDAENGSHATFTVFPEYSVPGPTGVQVIEDWVRSDAWPCNTIVIAGIDGLEKVQYRNLCAARDTAFDAANAPERLREDEWVNCCITWVKDMHGGVRRWIQPKIRPAWLEKNISHQSMFNGNAVFVFKFLLAGVDYPCRFLTLVCFDWVSREAGRIVWDEVFGELSDRWSTPTPLHWVFVIQQNDDPNHHTFLDSTHDCFDTAVQPMIDRTHVAIVLANNAATHNPGRSNKGGFSAIVYGGQAPFDCSSCLPSVCTLPAKRRGATKLTHLKDSVFRESGACIHSFTVRIPYFVSDSAADHHPPVDEAKTFSLNGQPDARRPDGPVPATIKWIHDELDELMCFVSIKLPISSEVEARTSETHQICVGEHRKLDAKLLENRMKLSASWWSSGDKSNRRHELLSTDDWDSEESAAFAYQIHALSMLTVAYDLRIADAVFHATFHCDEAPVEFVIISGATHKHVFEYVRDFLPQIHHRTVIVSCDKGISPLNDRERSFLDPPDASRCSDVSITDPSYGREPVGFASWRDEWSQAEDIASVRSRFDALL